MELSRISLLVHLFSRAILVGERWEKRLRLSVVPTLQMQGKDLDHESTVGKGELLDWFRCAAEKVHACFFPYACPLTSFSHAVTFLLMLH